MTTQFCSYFFTPKGCAKGLSCTFSHKTHIPRIPRKCRGCAVPRDLCVYLHDDETWTQGMRPVVHPSHRAAYLKIELAAADKEIAELRMKVSELLLTRPSAPLPPVAPVPREEKWPRGGPSDKDTKPEKPETEKPETEKPETEKPETEKPEPVA